MTIDIPPVTSTTTTLPDLFFEAASRYPEHPALMSYETTLSYREVAEQVRALAGGLRECGIMPGDVVGVALDRGTSLVLSMLASMTAGATFLPLDPAYPEQRLAHIANSSRTSLIITDHQHPVALPEEHATIDFRDIPRPTDLHLADLNELKVDTRYPAYLIYTSGSTGNPKGVLVGHDGISAIQEFQRHNTPVAPGDRIVQICSPNFDASIIEYIWGLTHGGALVVVPRDRIIGDALLQTFRDWKITHAAIPTAMLSSLTPHDIPSLRYIMVGGESLPQKTVDTWAGDITLVNVYGPTETTMFSTAALMEPGQAPTIGKAVAGDQLLILKPDLSNSKTGEVGELYIAGHGVALGYQGRPDQTAERFIANPFSTDGARMYRTGDLASRSTDGSLVFHGRSDNQIKLRGFRIELEEVAEALERNPEVSRAVAQVSQIGSARGLVAHVQRTAGSELTPDQLRTFASEELPEYMVPQVVFVLDQLPLNPNGKVDRASLPQPDLASFIGEYVEPATEEERVIAQAFASTLSLPSFSATGDFFSMGGDSISAMNALAQVDQALGRSVPAAAIFSSPTPRELGKIATESAIPPEIKRHDRAVLAPLTKAQKRMWFLYDLDRASSEYYVGQGYTIEGDLNYAYLAQAISNLQTHHEILRTTTHQTAEGPRLKIHPAGTLPVEMNYVDLSEDATVAPHRIEETIQTEVNAPFSLEDEAPFRVLLVKTAADRHVLVLSMHHIASDGWSIGVLQRDLSLFYAAASRGETIPDDSPDRLDYVDYAAVEDELMAGVSANAEEFWRRNLDGFDRTELPLTVERPAVRNPAGAIYRIELPDHVVSVLRSHAEETGRTVFQLLATAMQLTLASHTGRMDVSFGMASSGRHFRFVDDMVGFFVNLSVIRTTFSPEMTISDAISQVTEDVKAALDNPIDFDQVVKLIDESKDPSRTPAVESLMVYQNAPTADLTLGSTRISQLDLPRDSALYDLIFEFEERPEGLRLNIEYATSLYSEGAVKALSATLISLLELVATGGQEQLSVALAPTSHEIERIQAWEGQQIVAPDASIQSQFDKVVANSPNDVAVVGDGIRLTYQQLDDCSRLLASRLQAAGVSHQDVVVLAQERGPQVIISMLAVVRVGAIYVPVHANDPEQRLAQLIGETDASLALVDHSFSDRVTGIRSIKVDVDRLLSDVESEQPIRFDTAAVDPQDLAYLMFTSGSTGRPKGVAISHSNVVALSQYPRWHEGFDRTLFHSSHAFDAATFEIWGPLLNGFTVVVAPADFSYDTDLGVYIERYQVNGLFLTTAVFNLHAAKDPRIFAGLENLMTGGEAAQKISFELVRAHCPDTTITNIYGPTETTTYAVEQLADVPIPSFLPEPIGAPMHDSQTYVLNATMERVPAGAVGELYIGGTGLARGYWQRPDLTATSFVASPFTPGERLYRTGDIVRWVAPGQLEYVNRVDHQVKVRGFRIELSEVENVIRTFPGVTQVAVIAHQFSSGGHQLVAYVAGIAEAGATSDPEVMQLRDFVGQTLPSHMVPAIIFPMEHVPLNNNGKVDRKALPEPILDKAHVSGTQPTTPTEAAVAEVFANNLRLDSVDADTDFFALGGDSIVSIQVVSQLRAAGFTVSAKDMFETPTVAALAQVLDQRGVSAVHSESRHDHHDRSQDVDVKNLQGVSEFPASPIMEWFLRSHPVAPDHFNMSARVSLPEDVDLTALAAACERVVAHHSMFGLQRLEESTFSVLTPAWRDVPFEVVSIPSHLDDHATEQWVARVIEKRQRSLDLHEGPVARFLVMQYDGPNGTQRNLTTIAHHLMMDAVSWRILLDDLAVAYMDLAKGRNETPVSLPSSTSFPSWAQALSEHTRTGAFDQEISSWQALVDVPTRLPTDHVVDGPGPVETESVYVSSLSAAETVSVIRHLPAQFRASANEILLAALGRVLTDWTGEDAFLVDVEGHGRDYEIPGIDLTRTIGWFTTIHPVRVIAAESWQQQLTQTQDSVRSAAHKGLGFGALKYLTSDDRITVTEREISFNYLGQFEAQQHGVFGTPELNVGSDHAPVEQRDYLIDVVAVVQDGILTISWFYSPEAHNLTTIENLAQRLLDELQSLYSQLDEPQVPSPQDFPLVALDDGTLRHIGADTVENILPMTPMQQGMLFHSRLDNSASYVEQMTLDLGGVADPTVFEHAWQTVLDARPELRVVPGYSVTNEPIQIVRSNVQVPFRITDLSALSTQEQDRTVHRFLAENLESGIDLEHAPLLRVDLFDRGGGKVWMIVTFHHLLLDGWSLPLVLGDVFQAFHGHALPDRPAFGDHLAELAQRDQAAGRSFWTETLGGFESATSLPFDRHPELSQESESSQRIAFGLTAAESAQLQALGRSERLTVNTLVQGAWAATLSVFSGSLDVVFGATTSGRSTSVPNIESAIGNFINTLPVRAQFEGSVALSTWLASIQKQQFLAREFDHMSLSEIQSLTEIPSDAPLFNSLIVFENYPLDQGDSSLGGVSVDAVSVKESTNYPITVGVYADTTIHGYLAFDPKFFDLDTAEALADTFAAMLRSFVASSADTPLGQLPGATNPPPAAIVHGDPIDPPNLRLGQLLPYFADKTPDAPALKTADRSWTFRELNHVVGSVAQRLRRAGVTHQVPVFVNVLRSARMYIAVQAIIRAGGIYVPLHPSTPLERVQHISTEHGVFHAVTGSESSGLFQSLHEVTTIELEDALDVSTSHLDSAEVLDYDGATHLDDAAYMIFTSGSTGSPKGIVATHRNVLSFVRDRLWPQHPLNMLFHGSISFDISTAELWLSPATGGATVIAPGHGTITPKIVRTAIQDYGVNIVAFATAVFHVFAKEDPGCLAGIEQLLIGGEPANPDAFQAVIEACPDIWIENAYGPSETTVAVTRGRLTEAMVRQPSMPIGSVMSGHSLYILDPFMRQVPVGVPGELYVAGDGVTQGYADDPLRTAEVFVANPFGSNDRLFRTGDIVKWNPDGTIAFFGRKDGQIKIRGNRLELGEVEVALERIPGVVRAAATAPTNPGGSKSLVGYVVLEAGRELDYDGLIAEMEKQVPDYMVPSYLVQLDAIPLNSNSKIDRKALPTPDWQRKVKAPEPATTPTEQLVMEVWSELMGIADLGRWDDFFDLGGDSLKSMQINAEFKRLLGIEIPLSTLFKRRSIADFAAAIDELLDVQFFDDDPSHQGFSDDNPLARN